MPSLLLRRLGGLALLAALAFPAGVAAQSAGRSLALDTHAGVHLLRPGANGGLVCDEATEAEANALNASQRRGASELRLTAIPSLNAEGATNFRIILRATDQLLARPEALLAFRRAAAKWERIIQTPVTTVIDVDFGPNRFASGPFGPNILGSANSATEFATASSPTDPGAGPAEMVAAMKRNTTNPQLLALYNAIPVPTPSTAPSGTGGRNLGRAVGGLISLQMLGFRPAVIDPNDPARGFGSVPNIGFNSIFAFDFDPGNGITANQTDFEGTAIHEIGHALGFTSNIGTGVTNTAVPIQFTPWDLFRVRPEAVTVGPAGTAGTGFNTALRVITPGPVTTDVLVVEGGVTYFRAVQTTFGGTEAYETSTATGGRVGGDGQQASHWRDDALRPPSLGADRVVGIMDPNIGAGQVVPIKRADIRLLELIGYAVNYAPASAIAAVTLNGTTVAQPLIVAERSLGDAPINGTTTATLRIANAGTTATGTANPLDYEVEILLDTASPDTVIPTLSLSRSQGVVAVGSGDDITLTFGGIGQPAFVGGRLRIRTNDNNRAVIEIPFTFSVGGATEPSLTLTSTLPANGDLGDVAPGARRAFTLSVANAGSLPLDYRIFATSSVRPLPISSTPMGATRGVAVDRVLFEAAFENPADLSQFIFDATAAPDRWQITAAGRAPLPGHSPRFAAYYGLPDGTFRYSDNSRGQLSTPVLDLSTLPGDNLVEVSFNYFLDAEVGFDFASVVYSIDRGRTFQTAATSNGGAIRQSVGEWRNLTVQIPGLAGFNEVQIGFRFESDVNTGGEGFYIDDVQIVAREGRSGFFASPVVGRVLGNSAQPITVTINATTLARGFYDGFVSVETNQRRADPPPVNVKFTVGNPVLPSVRTVAAQPTFSVAPQRVPVSLALRNPGDAPLSFVRVLEPAASAFATAPTTFTGDAVAALRAPAGAVVTADVEPEPASDGAARVLPDGDITAQVVLPGASLPGDLTQLPDGRILVLDIGQASAPGSFGQGYILSEDLATVTRIPSVFTGQITGVAYNSRTNSLWIAELSTGAIREFTIGGTTAAPTFVATNRRFTTSFSPVGLEYSPELDALFTTPFQTAAVYALDITGVILPGYPTLVAGRGPTTINVLPGLSFTEGLLEIGGSTNLQIVQTGQFGRAFTGGVTIDETAVRLGGTARINGYLRSRTNPNTAAYYVANPSATVSRVFRVDPPNLQAGIGTRIDAGGAVFSNQGINAQATFAVPLVIDATGLMAGTYTEQIAFLTNNPVGQLVRIPIQVQVVGTAAEGDAAGEFALQAAFPNPVRGQGTLRFSLPEAAGVTVSVYNALGQRVALLADGDEMAAGTHDLAFPTAGLAAGVYVVRLQAGANTGTQRVTVVR